MWIKTKWLPVFNQNYRFKGISLVSLITFNQIIFFQLNLSMMILKHVVLQRVNQF